MRGPSVRSRGVWIAAAVVVAAGAVVGGRALWTGNDPPADPVAFCERVRHFRQAIDGLGRGPESADQVEEARDAAARVAETARSLASAAPEEIAADVESMAEASAAVADELRAFYDEVLTDPDLAQDARYLASFEISDREQQAAEQAAGRVRPWIERHCGIELEPAEETPGVP